MLCEIEGDEVVISLEDLFKRSNKWQGKSVGLAACKELLFK